MQGGDVDPDALEEFRAKVLGDVSAAFGVLLAYMGDRLGLFRALATGGPMTSGDLAERTGTAERYVREWLAANAAGGYVSYDPETERFSLTPEQALILAAEEDPNCMAGFFQMAAANCLDEPKVREAFETGQGLPWGDRDDGVFDASRRNARGRGALLVESWLPSLDGVDARLRAGARVADIGCGSGTTTIAMAEAYPDAVFCGYDVHAPSIEGARERARRAGVEDNTTFEVAGAADYPGEDYDLVVMVDVLHHMGDPVGTSRHVRETLRDDGSFMLAEFLVADALEENLDPLGRLLYSASTMLCLPDSCSNIDLGSADGAQQMDLALGTAAGERRLTEVVHEAGFTKVRRSAETPPLMVLEVRP